MFLYDKFQKVGAAAHITLPGSSSQWDSDNMLREIIESMLALGCHPLVLRARLVGGANIMNISTYRIGYRNIVYVKKELRKRGIIIKAEDTGGKESRTARLDIESGVLSINNSKQNYYTI